MIHYEHPSGLKVVKIQNDDPQNVACILFKTIPQSSNGCPHVLEHVVLCGSKKFDVKDPFFSMLRRSLSGFANAFTGSDFTCYPFAAHIKEDFYNLFEVYLDAVFHPLLDKASFLQEGWRITHEGYKGIVFNEMKQSHSSLFDRFHHKTVELLFPDTPYRFDSGGVPNEIVELTHKELQEFHKKFYHPSQGLIFLYGNLDIDPQLAQIEKAIESIEPIQSVPSALIYQEKFSNKKVVHSHYPASNEEDGHHVTIGFLISDHKHPEKLLQAQFLKMLLTDNDACLLSRAILEKQLASSIDVVTDFEVLQPYLYFVFKDVTDTKQLIHTFDKVLQQACERDFDLSEKTSFLHQLKIAFLNTVAEGYPVGLTLFFRGFLSSLNGADPVKLLSFKEQIHALEVWMHSHENIQQALKEFFIDNTHRVEVHFDPKEGMLEEELPTPPALDASIKNTILEDEKLIEQKRQSASDASKLPILHIDHLPLKPPTYQIHKVDAVVPFYVHNTWTNGLSYLDLFIDLPKLNTHELHVLGFLLHLLSEVGTNEQSFEEVLRYKDSILSTIHFSILPVQDRLVLLCSTDCLSENLDQVFRFIEKVLLATSFEESARVEEIFKDLLSSYKTSFRQRGIGKCVLKTKSVLHTGYKALEDIKGFSFYFWLKEQQKKPIQELITDLKAVYEKLLDAKGAVEASIVTELSQIPSLNILSRNKTETFIIEPLHAETKGLFYTYNVPTHANENAFSFPAFDYFAEDSAVARVIVQLTKHLQLHPLLREIHGAYGASMSYDMDMATMTMYTSCDPNIDTTYKIFEEALHSIAEGLYTDEDLYEAKLAALQKTEGITPLNQRATHQYLMDRMGKTLELRKEHRNRLIRADRSAIRETTIKILNKLTGGVAATMGGKSSLQASKKPPTANVEL